MDKQLPGISAMLTTRTGCHSVECEILNNQCPVFFNACVHVFVVFRLPCQPGPKAEPIPTQPKKKY